MISREEAKDINLVVKGDTYKVHKLIDDIYDSIGNCGECVHYDNKGHVSICGHDLGLCDIVLDKDAYCYHFEKEKDHE